MKSFRHFAGFIDIEKLYWIYSGEMVHSEHYKKNLQKPVDLLLQYIFHYHQIGNNVVRYVPEELFASFI